MTETINRQGLAANYWKKKPLEDMSRPEWEALCDGCGKCCLVKLENDATDKVHYTNVACRLFDAGSCSCGNYALRKQMVAGCVVLTPENLEYSVDWMPNTCAYKLVYHNDPLPEWHPLITGDPASVHTSGTSMLNKVVAEYDVEDENLEDYIVEGLQ